MLVLFIICFGASVIGGICGIGGGVLIKPLLDAAGLMSVSQASFLSGLTVLCMSSVNCIRSRNTNQIDTACSLPLGLGAAIGGISGKYFFELIKRVSGNDTLVGQVQTVLLAAMVLFTLVYTLVENRINTKHVKSRLGGIFIGLMLGICSSFLGIGGGPMNLLVLSWFYSMPVKKASINSLLIIFLSQTASLVVSILTNAVPVFSWGDLAVMVLGGIGGGFLSAELRRKISEEQTKKLFIGLLIAILFICLFHFFA